MSSREMNVLLEAKSYHRIAASGKIGEKPMDNNKKFTFITQAIEKYFMYSLLKKSVIPADHKLLDLYKIYQKLTPLETGMELADKLDKMDKIDNLCSLDVYKSEKLSNQDIDSMLAITNEVAQLIKKEE